MRLPQVCFAVALALLTCSTAAAQSNSRGSCDASAPREKRSIEFIIETRADTASNFVARRPCTNEQVEIPQCAVVSVHTRKSQHYCIDTGHPDYSEQVSFIEYWEASTKETPTK